jgi:glycosyltransferase involved in cell wall biosynthesis
MDACTIISGNFLAQARVMIRSYRDHNPDGRFFVLFIDPPPKNIDLSKEPFEVILLDDIKTASACEALRMKYTAYELCMAMRPSLLAHMFQDQRCERIVYLDSDLYFTGSIGEIDQLLNTHNVILTPSFLSPIPDDGMVPGDREILAAGTFNGGCCAVRRSAAVDSMLKWWDERLMKYAYLRPEDNMFGDQKWMDLIPSIVDGVHVLRDPKHNVAFWNLHERTVTHNGHRYSIGSKLMTFFHFSGFRIKHPDTISIHQNRYTFPESSGIIRLCREYAEKLHLEGYDYFSNVPYSFDAFDDGVAITPLIRRVFESMEESIGSKPLFKADAGSWKAWLLTSHQGGSSVSNLHERIHRISDEVSIRFPSLEGEGLRAYAQWMRSEASPLFRLDKAFTDSLPAPRKIPRSVRSIIRMTADTRHTLEWYQRLCKKIKKIFGTAFFYRIQAILMPQSRGNQGRFRKYFFRLKRKAKRTSVRILGPWNSPTGISTGVRAHLKSLASTGIDVSENSDIVIVAAGLDDFDRLLAHLDREGFSGKRIGYIVYEESTFPDAYVHLLSAFDEIWVPSRFVADALTPLSPVPVVIIPYPIDVPETIRKDRGNTKGCFTCSFFFDFRSCFERKNPLGVVSAFEGAFKDRHDRQLLLKALGGKEYPEERKQLLDAIKGKKNIRLLEEEISREETLALMASSNLYVSLHRSEGFGLTIAEAMALGAPVIGTNYGGCKDFLTSETGFPIRSGVHKIEHVFKPYTIGNHWAEPDLQQAAAIMRDIADGHIDPSGKVTAAQKLILSSLSVRTIGKRMADRLSVVGSNY